jgi:uncharacterized protein (DUF1800 family)
LAGEARALIAHLFRRAGFGARPAELDYYTSQGYAKAVEDLVSGRPLMNAQPSDDALAPITTTVRNLRGRVAPEALPDIQLRWVKRMATTTAPLVERMTLFMHDHWATGYRPVDNIDTTELAAQNDLFRRYALGDWRALCHAMIEDVALSCWLDNNVNHKEHPNENLAREFMELFTLGVGNYSERDIREAARALTGYTLAYTLDPTAPRYKMAFSAPAHDEGDKTILGITGAFLPHDFVDIVLAQPAAPRFIANKLARHFVGPTASPTLGEEVAAEFVASGWQLRSALRAIFLSGEFRSQAARSGTVKSPTEFMVGALRGLNLSGDDQIRTALYWSDQAGQSLFDPPNVGGWPSNEGWLGGAGILARYNAAVQIADAHIGKFLLPGQARLRGGSIDGWGEIFGISDLAPETRTALNDYLQSATAAAADEATQDAAMITLVLSSPDYTLA